MVHSSQGADEDSIPKHLTPKGSTNGNGVRPASRKREQYGRAEANEAASGTANRESPIATQKKSNTNTGTGTMISRGQRFLNQQK